MFGWLIRTGRAGAALVAAVAVLGGGAAAADSLPVNVFNWESYLGPTTIADFTKETGLKANLSYYDSEEMADAKVMTGKTGYDVVVINAEPFLGQEVKANAYRPLDLAKIPNWKNLDPELMKIMAKSDPGNVHAAIYQWGTIGLGYNVDAVAKRIPNAPTDSWALLFDPANVSKLKDCGVNVIDSPAIVVPLALKYLGKEPSSTDPADLAAAQKLLISIRPYLKTINDSSWIADMATGTVCLTIGWNGDVLASANRARDAKNDIKVQYVVPKEGSIIWFDALAVPADSPNPEGAMSFVNYMLEPATIAKCGDTTNYANGVPASQSFMRPEIVKDARIYPAADVIQRLFLQSEVPASYERQRTRTWAAVKAAGS